MFPPSGQKDPVRRLAFLDDDLVNDPHHLFLLRCDLCRKAPFLEGLENGFRLFLESFFQHGEAFLAGRDADGTRDVRNDRSLDQAPIHDVSL
jgi:hypothetical protein